MAYFLYNRTHENGRDRFIWQGKTHLFGCNKGVVANALKTQIPDGQQPPWCWHINVPDYLRQQNSIGAVFVIDLKPRQREENNEFSFYELLEVWGCSYEGQYTTALLRLQSLLTDHQDNDLDYKDFIINHEVDNSPIFTFLYFAGDVCNGRLNGPWTAPNRSATNSALLWPEDFDYFIPIIQQHLGRDQADGCCLSP